MPVLLPLLLPANADDHLRGLDGVAGRRHRARPRRLHAPRESRVDGSPGSGATVSRSPAKAAVAAGEAGRLAVSRGIGARAERGAGRFADPVAARRGRARPARAKHTRIVSVSSKIGKAVGDRIEECAAPPGGEEARPGLLAWRADDQIGGRRTPVPLSAWASSRSSSAAPTTARWSPLIEAAQPSRTRPAGCTRILDRNHLESDAGSGQVAQVRCTLHRPRPRVPGPIPRPSTTSRRPSPRSRTCPADGDAEAGACASSTTRSPTPRSPCRSGLPPCAWDLLVPPSTSTAAVSSSAAPSNGKSSPLMGSSLSDALPEPRPLLGPVERRRRAWGVVVSLTTKLYKDGPTAGASLTFDSPHFPSLKA